MFHACSSRRLCKRSSPTCTADFRSAIVLIEVDTSPCLQSTLLHWASTRNRVLLRTADTARVLPYFADIHGSGLHYRLFQAGADTRTCFQSLAMHQHRRRFPPPLQLHCLVRLVSHLARSLRSQRRTRMDALLLRNHDRRYSRNSVRIDMSCDCSLQNVRPSVDTSDIASSPVQSRS